jgi:hypothetical protein
VCNAHIGTSKLPRCCPWAVYLCRHNIVATVVPCFKTLHETLSKLKAWCIKKCVFILTNQILDWLDIKSHKPVQAYCAAAKVYTGLCMPLKKIKLKLISGQMFEAGLVVMEHISCPTGGQLECNCTAE